MIRARPSLWLSSIGPLPWMTKVQYEAEYQETRQYRPALELFQSHKDQQDGHDGDINEKSIPSRISQSGILWTIDYICQLAALL